MALITIAGFPSSGKSTRAQQIRAALETRLDGPISRVLVLSDHSLDILPSAYDLSALEKPARGTLFAAVQRFLATDTILILDSLNYIKGFRYQLYCAAREMKLRTCTVRRYSLTSITLPPQESRYMSLPLPISVDSGIPTARTAIHPKRKSARFRSISISHRLSQPR